MQHRADDTAAAMLPVTLLVAVCGATSEGYRGVLFMMCLVMVPLLALLLLAGLRYYLRRPVTGLLTSLVLLGLLPISHGATHVNGWQAFFGIVTSLVGGGCTLLFLVLTLMAMNRSGDAA